jgi:GT2 family glycosyltransferase
MNPPLVSIVLLNWNNWPLTLDCLESLYQNEYLSFRVVIVDNGSTDQSEKQIMDYCQGKLKIQNSRLEFVESNKPIRIRKLYRKALSEESENIKDNPGSIRDITLIMNEKNIGFASGCNVGIEYALERQNPDYVLLLNNDILMDKAFLAELVKACENDDKVGFAGPKIYFYELDGQTDFINSAGCKVSTLTGFSSSFGFGQADRGQLDTPRYVDSLGGSAMLMRARTLKASGFLDPRFFAYWEETDLCFRGRALGFQSLYVPKSKIWHKVSATIQSSTKVYFMTRNRFLFERKNSTRGQFTIFMLCQMSIGLCFDVFIFLKNEKEFKWLKPYLRGLADGMRSKWSTVESGK